MKLKKMHTGESLSINEQFSGRGKPRRVRRQAAKRSNYFLSRRVRDRKYFSDCKRASIASAVQQSAKHIAVLKPHWGFKTGKEAFAVAKASWLGCFRGSYLLPKR